MAYISNPKQIAINGTILDVPPEFHPKRQDIYAGEITTCTGKLIADKVGWKYADMTLKWPALPQSKVNTLIAMNGEATFQFYDLDGEAHNGQTNNPPAEKIIRTSAVGLRHRDTIGENVYWKDVSVTIRFLNPHTS